MSQPGASITSEITIPAGYYSGVQHILNKMREQLRPTKYLYDPLSRRVSVELQRDCKLHLNKSDIATCLGFHNGKTLEGTNKYLSESLATVRNTYYSIYVYTDIIENLNAGDYKVPLLRVVPVKADYGELCCVNYDRPHFISLNQSNIQTIEIDLRDDVGDLISFESGKVVVTLVFRRKQARFY